MHNSLNRVCLSIAVAVVTALFPDRDATAQSNLIGRWITGPADYLDKSGFTPAGTHDGTAIGTGQSWSSGRQRPVAEPQRGWRGEDRQHQDQRGELCQHVRQRCCQQHHRHVLGQGLADCGLESVGFEEWREQLGLAGPPAGRQQQRHLHHPGHPWR